MDELYERSDVKRAPVPKKRVATPHHDDRRLFFFAEISKLK